MLLNAQLEDVIANRKWLRRERPFPHIVASHIFMPAFYEQLEKAFRESMARGFGRTAQQFARRMQHYDAYSLDLTPGTPWPLSVFTSRAWHDVLARLTGVRATGHVNACMHHHPAGSAHGRVHNDLNPGWFVDDEAADGIRLARHELCSYKHGTSSAEGWRAHRLVRAVVMLFYFCNPSWAPGDGGETGLYWSHEDEVERPATAVAPINNSLLLFECTPYSYHSFLRNTRGERNSVIMWLHREQAEVEARWGAKAIVEWPPPVA